MSLFISLEERNRIADALHRDQAPLLEASIDEAVDGKVSYADLEMGLTIRIPFVDGMRVDGRYHAVLQSVDGPGGFGMGGTIQEANQDIVVDVPADRALEFQGQQAALYYFYLEYPVEETKSPVVVLSMEGQIYKPVVDEAVDGMIALPVVVQGVNLRIRAGSSLTSGALVSVYWWGSSADACFVKHMVIGPGPVEDLVVPVGADFLVPIKHGTVRVIYTVQSTAGTRVSPVLELGVAGDLAVPAGIHQQGQETRSVVHLSAINEGGSYPFRQLTQGMVAGDVVIFFFTGYRLGSELVIRHTVKQSDITAGLIMFGVPISYLSLQESAWVWSMVDRPEGGAVGSPDLPLFLVSPSRSGGQCL